MVADGRIKAIRGTFDHYDGKTIVMTGGEKVTADVAILAIGFKLGVPFLPEAYRNKLVEPDGQYRLYRVIANPDLPDMGFVDSIRASAACCARRWQPTGWCAIATVSW